jgi:hypothetical protein
MPIRGSRDVMVRLSADIGAIRDSRHAAPASRLPASRFPLMLSG